MRWWLLLWVFVYGQTPDITGKWVGVVLGNAPDHKVIFKLEQDEKGNVKGSVYGYSPVAGEYKCEVKGYYDVQRRIYVLQDVRFLIRKPKAPWIMCLTERYELKLQGDSLKGYYYSRACRDYAQLFLKNVYRPQKPSKRSLCMGRSLRQLQLQMPILFFEPNRSEIAQRYYSSLDSVAQLLKQCPWLSLKIVGFTDSTGHPSYDKRLSLERALKVKQYLVDRGVNRKQLEVEGRGYAKPLVPHASRYAGLLNRRVELLLRTQR